MSSLPELGHESFGIGTLFNRLADALIVVDVDSARIVLCNPVAQTLFGYGELELLGRPLETIVPGGFPGGALSRSPIALDGLAHDGRPLWLEVSLSPIENMHVPGRFQLAIVRDVAERRRYEAALEASEARFRTFMDNGPAIASIRDEAGCYVYMNAMHRRIFRSHHWIGTTAQDNLPPEIAAQVLADDRLVLQSGQPAHFEEQMPGVDQTLTLMVFKFPFLDSDGQRLVGSLGVDITPLKRAQAALLERTKSLEEANEALRLADVYKDDFLSVLSHELRTPITAIVGFTEFLEDEVEGALSPAQREFVTQIEKATHRLLALVNDLIDFAQLQAGAFQLHAQEADLASAIREMAESLCPQAEEAGITLRIETPPHPLWAHIDARQIGRVVLNLVGNALRYTPAGGTVVVKSTLTDRRLLTTVTDTGVGVAESDVPKLFDRFWQRDTSTTRTGSGLGLGLPIAKAIIEGHGGEIGATSTPGAGSTFWFALETEPVQE